MTRNGCVHRANIAIGDDWSCIHCAADVREAWTNSLGYIYCSQTCAEIDARRATESEAKP